MPLEVGTPIEEGECAQCTVCVTACPAQAIQGREWQLGMRREELVDAFACQSAGRRLMHERTGMIDTALCGLCVAICPMGRKKANKNQ
jgi:epoxyqueuosine reductase QueG